MAFFSLTQVFSDTTEHLSKSYYKLWFKIVREFPQKLFFFKSSKVAATGNYGIENHLSDVISKLCLFGGTACSLSRVMLVRMAY